MRAWWRRQLARRPVWMNLLMFFCAYMAFVYVPWDLLVKPVEADVQVWFGIALHGWAAKLTTPLHGAIYGLATYGFWRMRPWMWPWASVYAGYLAVSALVWAWLSLEGWGGAVLGLASAGALTGLAVGLARARPHFEPAALRMRERYGEWAVVTGASAGIGAAFARALAREGMSLVLVARRTERLEELAAELEKTHAIATRVVSADLARAEGVEAVVEAVAELDVGLLVNNAGFGYQGRFERQELSRLREMIALNCVAPVELTARLLPAMRDRGRGAVLITGSVAGCQPLPFHAIYGATKGFEQLFGEALWAELEGSGIDVLVVQPGTTASEFHEVAGVISAPGRPAEQVVADGLAALGRQPSLITDWLNWVRCNVGMRLLPRSWLALAARAFSEERTREELR